MEYCNTFDEPIEPVGVSYLSPLPPLSTGIYYKITPYAWEELTELRIPKPVGIEINASCPPGCAVTGTEVGSEVVVFDTECPNPMPDDFVHLAIMVDEVNPPLRKTSVSYVKNMEKILEGIVPFDTYHYSGESRAFTFDSPVRTSADLDMEGFDEKLCEIIRLLLSPQGSRATACCEEMVFPGGKDIAGYCGDVEDEKSDRGEGLGGNLTRAGSRPAWR